MTAKEDKKTPARVGRVPGLILAQRWGRPSLAGGVFLIKLRFESHTLCITLHK